MKKFMFLALLPVMAIVAMLLTNVQKAEAATCNFPQDITVNRGQGVMTEHTLANFPVALYYFDVHYTGNIYGFFNLTVQANPGIFKNNRYGFRGPSTTMRVSYFIGNWAFPGEYNDITIDIYALNGQLVCSGTFRVTIAGEPQQTPTPTPTPEPGWTDWLDRDDPSGAGDWENREAFTDVCEAPMSFEARRVDTGEEASTTGEVFLHFSNDRGLICRNEDQPDGQCFDYEVRFLCQ